MAAPAIPTQGTTITFHSVTVNGHQAITGIGSGTASKIDVTTLASTAKEFRMGLQDWGDMQLKFIWNLDDLGQAEMYAYKDSQTAGSLVITFPATDPVVTANVFTANVYVLQMQADVNADGVLQGTATLAVTGEPSWT